MRRDAGFTLIELLVALAITSMIALAGSSLLISTLRASSGLQAHVSDVRVLDIAHSLLRDDLANAQNRLGRGTDGLALAAVFVGREIEGRRPFIEFTRGGWGRSGSDELRGDQQRIEYIFKDGEIIRRAWLRPDPVDQTPYADRVLVSGLEEVAVRYGANGQWFAQWPDSQSDMPRLVELSLTFSADDMLTERFLVGTGG